MNKLMTDNTDRQDSPNHYKLVEILGSIFIVLFALASIYNQFVSTENKIKSDKYYSDNLGLRFEIKTVYIEENKLVESSSPMSTYNVLTMTSGEVIKVHLDNINPNDSVVIQQSSSGFMLCLDSGHCGQIQY